VRSIQLIQVVLFLTGCAHTPMSLISLDESKTSDLSSVSVIMEDQNRPALLKGLDGRLIPSVRIPDPFFGNYAYVMNAGTHVFWLKGLPYPHPLIPQRLSCYKMRVELEQGKRYLLKEEPHEKRAVIISVATGAIESTGKLVDEPWVFIRDCKWD
jgi:hypothetical protein